MLSVCVLSGATAWAELPPYVYEERQHAAPEALTIKVISAKISHNETREAVIRGVVAKAEIISVEHSATSLKRGSTITIAYTTTEYKTPRPGPSEPAILREGTQSPAYLQKDEKTGNYTPAAGGWSFSPKR